MTDQQITCSECGGVFTFTEAEHQFYESKGLAAPPKRCRPCRQARKTAREGDGGGGSEGRRAGGPGPSRAFGVGAGAGTNPRPFGDRGDRGDRAARPPRTFGADRGGERAAGAPLSRGTDSRFARDRGPGASSAGAGTGAMAPRWGERPRTPRPFGEGGERPSHARARPEGGDYRPAAPGERPARSQGQGSWGARGGSVGDGRPNATAPRRFDAPRRAESPRPDAPAEPQKPRARAEKPRFDIVCSTCGTPSQVPFKPLEGREVFCQPCYRARRGPTDGSVFQDANGAADASGPGEHLEGLEGAESPSSELDGGEFSSN